MPFSGGTYGAPSSSWNPAVAATTIDVTDWAALLSDLSTALSTAMLKDGSQTVTANITMASHKFTGLSAGTVAGDSVRYEQVIGAFLPITGGTLTGNLLFTDATYDIGASGATRPRDFYLSRNAVIGGTADVAGNFSVATNKFNVTAASGNTLIAGTLGVTGVATLASPVLNTGVSGTALANQAAADAGTSGTLLWTPALRKVSLLATQATTSGTSKDFVLPAGVTEFKIPFVGVSGNGTSNMQIQLSVASTPITTGYTGGVSLDTGGTRVAYSTGVVITTNNTAALIWHGVATFNLIDAATFEWAVTSIMTDSSTPFSVHGSGTIVLAGVVTGYRTTFVNGTDAYDLGKIGGNYIL